MSLRSHSSDPCLVAKHPLHSGPLAFAPFTSPVQTRSPEELLRRFVNLKSEQAWNSLLESRETAHANEIADLQNEQTDALKELQEAKAQAEKDFERADRSKTYLQKQLKKIHAAKEDAQKTCETIQEQLAKLQVEYTEVENALHAENLGRQAAEEHCQTLQAQLADQNAGYLTRDGVLTEENARLMRVVSDMQTRNYDLEFQLMNHVSCITEEQYKQAQEAWKRELDGVKQTLAEVNYGFHHQQFNREVTASAHEVEARTKQVEYYVEEVKKLTAELGKMQREMISREVVSKIRDETVVKELGRLVASRDTLEKRLEALQKAYRELSAYHRGLLSSSDKILIEAALKALQYLREDRDILATSFAGAMSTREAAEQESLSWRSKCNDLNVEMTEKDDKVADMEAKVLKYENIAFQAEVEVGYVIGSKDEIIEKRDEKIAELEQKVQGWQHHVRWMAQQNADSQTAWLLDFQHKEIENQKRALTEARVALQKEIDKHPAVKADEVGPASEELHQQDDVADGQEGQGDSEDKVEKSETQVQGPEITVDRAPTAEALRNAFAQSQEQAVGHDGEIESQTINSEAGASDHTVIKNEHDDIDAYHSEARHFTLNDVHRATEEFDRQLAEKIQFNRYRSPILDVSKLKTVPEIPLPQKVMNMDVNGTEMLVEDSVTPSPYDHLDLDAFDNLRLQEWRAAKAALGDDGEYDDGPQYHFAPAEAGPSTSACEDHSQGETEETVGSE